jgi:NAD dependent epimerase/dehydratase
VADGIAMELIGKRVLVTGADGFIGSHLVELLVKDGANVRALTQYNSFIDWGWLEGSPCLAAAEVVAGDVRDPHFCEGLMRDVEVVFHLAALIPIPYSYVAPDSYVDTNVKGTLNLCQAARGHGIRKFVHTSTSEVYGTAQYVPIDERHPLVPQSPYSATKIAADALALSFFYAFGLPVVVARPFNTYGPRQSARAVIPTIISQLASGIREVRIGDLTTTRDFTFVEDTCRGLAAIAGLEGGLGETFNIGSNLEVSIGDLFRLIADCMDVPAAVALRDEQRVRPAASEVQRLWCDNTKLARAANFRPQVSLREGLGVTIAWFQDPRNLRRYKPTLYNR